MADTYKWDNGLFFWQTNSLRPSMIQNRRINIYFTWIMHGVIYRPSNISDITKDGCARVPLGLYCQMR